MRQTEDSVVEMGLRNRAAVLVARHTLARRRWIAVVALPAGALVLAALDVASNP
jgi:hypothetical protein